jgi:hypothetical protein
MQLILNSIFKIRIDATSVYAGYKRFASVHSPMLLACPLTQKVPERVSPASLEPRASHTPGGFIRAEVQRLSRFKFEWLWVAIPLASDTTILAINAFVLIFSGTNGRRSLVSECLRAF